jgi:diguanylate cyclase (GGDEF)-like protein
VNDSFGYAAGDQLLAAIALRLDGAVRPGDLVARLGGDEFTVLLDNVEEAGQAARVAQRILDQFLKPFYVDEPQAGGNAPRHVVHVSQASESPAERIASTTVL